MKSGSKKIFRKIMMIFLGLLLLVVLGSALYMRHEKFGDSPSGARLERIQASPNYKNNQFQNLSPTPSLAEGHNYFGILKTMLFDRAARREPANPIPSVKTDLHSLPADSNFLVWFGHSSYYMQIDGSRFLVDPVFSENPVPFPAAMKPFKGANIYTTADIPPIDFLIITHDHYDHADYETLKALRPKINKVICGLGVGAHLERWGYDPAMLIEKDWQESVELRDGFSAFIAPARHFSGRKLKRNGTLWISVLLQTPSLKIYIGGDSGYDSHYKSVGEKFDSIDLAILDNGQYDPAWKYIHHLPQQVLDATRDLKAKRLFPVHSSKFAIANHAWDDPLKQIDSLNRQAMIPMITPKIGEPVRLSDPSQQFEKWWENHE